MLKNFIRLIALFAICAALVVSPNEKAISGPDEVGAIQVIIYYYDENTGEFLYRDDNNYRAVHGHATPHLQEYHSRTFESMVRERFSHDNNHEVTIVVEAREFYHLYVPTGMG